MVETSVAVAIPSITAKRITRQDQRRQRHQEQATDLGLGEALDVGQILVAITPPDDEAQRQTADHARQQATGGLLARRSTSGHRTDGDQHDTRRHRFGLRPGHR